MMQNGAQASVKRISRIDLQAQEETTGVVRPDQLNDYPAKSDLRNYYAVPNFEEESLSFLISFFLYNKIRGFKILTLLGLF